MHRLRRSVTQIVLADAGVPVTPGVSRAVVAFVDERIGSMPPHLRAGVLAVEALLALIPRMGLDAGMARRMRHWETSRLPPVAQYVRLIRSLVLLAAYEMSPDEGETIR